MAMIQVRRLVEDEKTSTIVLYFSITASAISLVTLPFGWDFLDLAPQIFLIAAGFCGGVAQILLTESYRHADVSTIAPFEYTSIVLGGVLAYFVFGDIPTLSMLFGTAIIVAAGIFIIYREHRLELERRASRGAG
jgi:drug/metabolite transporter (DMT)-like permease